jgi:hypothetical protein
MVIAGMFIAAWSILTVELTLAWNSVKGVYNIQSTGQIIALVVGLGILVKVLWLLRHGKVSSQPSVLMSTILTPGSRPRYRNCFGQGQNGWMSATRHHARCERGSGAWRVTDECWMFMPCTNSRMIVDTVCV